MKILVLVTSDRCYNKIYEDYSGEAIIKILKSYNSDYITKKVIIDDDYDKIINTFIEHKEYDWIITSGGTGISPKDFTHTATRDYCEKEIVGISEYLRNKSLEETIFAVFSNGYSGIKNNTIIVNVPGSEKGAVFCTKLLLPILEHGVNMLKGLPH